VNKFPERKFENPLSNADTHLRGDKPFQYYGNNNLIITSIIKKDFDQAIKSLDYILKTTIKERELYWKLKLEIYQHIKDKKGWETTIKAFELESKLNYLLAIQNTPKIDL
jgi:hypothetical protein